MKYFLLISNSEGEARLVPISDVMEVAVEPGDDIVVMDESGKAVDVSLRPDDDDLIVDFQDGSKAVLKDFYNQEEDSDPITISLNPVEPVADDYEFNSQTGNLPNAKSFTLMRYSNTEYVQFVEQLDELKGGVIEGALQGLGFSGGENSGISGRRDDLDLILDPTPVAAPDSGSGVDRNLINIDLLGNDTDERGEGIEIHSVGGIGVVEGSVVTLASGSQVTVNADGTIDFLPGSSFDSLGPGDSDTETFVYSIRDGGGNLATSEVTVTVAGVNDPPVANPDEYELTEDSPITVNVLENDSDPDASDTLTVTGISNPPGGTAVVNGDNTVTFDPGGDFDFLGKGESTTVELTYTISDGSGATATSTVTFTISGVNDAPDAIDDSATTDEDSVVTIDAIANDTDPDTSDDLLIIGFDQPAKGSVTLNSQNQLVFDPGSDFQDLDEMQSETVTFDYSISDGNGGTDTATITVTVTGSDDPTATNPDSAVTDENTPLVVDVLANDTDPDSNDIPLTVTGITQPPAGQGSVAISNGGADVTFTPGTDFDDLAIGESETVNFTYTTDTGPTETVTVTVEGRNDAPVAVNDTGAVNEDATLVVNAANGVIETNDTDADGTDVLEVSAIRTGPEGGTGVGALVGNPLVGTYGTLTLNADGSYNYAADQDAADPLAVGVAATDTFTYEISDGNGGGDTAELVITITGTNDAPLPNPPGGTPGVDPGVYDDSNTIAEDAAVPATGNVLANDVDPDTGGMLAVSEVNGVAGNVTNPVVGTYGTVTIDQDGSYSYVLDNANPVVQALAVGESTTDTFTYTADDSNGGTATATLTITINGTNDVPPSNPPGGTPGVDFGVYDDSNSIEEDEFPNNVIGNVLANDLDPDGDTLTVSEVNGVAANTGSQVAGTYGEVAINEDGSYNYVLDNSNPAIQALAVGATTTDSFTYTADDGNGGSATATLTITITGTNDGPVAADDNGVGDEDNDITGNVVTNDTDIDGDSPLIVVGNTDPSNGTLIIAANGAYTYTPNPNFNGTDSFTYTIEDPTGATDTASVTLTVNPVNDPPSAVADNGTAEENAPVTIDVLDNDSDIEGDTLTVTSIDDSGLTGGTATLNIDNTVTFDPGSDFDDLAVGETATETLTYVVEDGNGGSDTSTVTITIEGQNDDPDAMDDSGVGDEDMAITGNVVTNDSDVDGDTPLLVVGNTTPAHGTLVIAPNGAYTYTPDPNYNGLDSFTYTIEDPNGGSDTATVTLTVNGQNDGPDTHQDTLHTMEGVGGLIDVIQNDSDVDSTQITITEINGSSVDANQAIELSSGGFVTVMEDGRIYFNPDGDYNYLGFGETATNSFTYTVEDDNGATAVETVSLVIDGVDNEVITSGAYQVLSDQLYEIVLDPSDESINYVPIGDPLTFDINSIAFNANDNLIYANARDDSAALGILKNDVIQINPFTGEIVGNLGQFTNDLGETVPTFAGVINSDINVYYVNGPEDSAGNTTYAIDLNTMAVTAIGSLPGADYGIDVNTGLLWSVANEKTYSLDPTSGVVNSYNHGGLQADGVILVGGTFGSVFSDGDGNIQTTSNEGHGLYEINTVTGALNRIGDAPASSSNDATGTRTSALPSALPYLFLDEDGSTNAASVYDTFQNYDPNGSPVSIADSDVRIADLDGDVISSARIVLQNSLPGDILGISGVLPGGISATVTNEGGFQVLTLLGDGSQGEYEAAIAAVTFSNIAPGSILTDPRQITVTLTDVNGVRGNTATSFVFIGGGSGIIAGRDVQIEDQGYSDQIVFHEDDFDPVTGGATFNLLENDSDNPTAIDSITQPSPGEGIVLNNGDGTVTFQPGEDFQYLSEGETAITTFTYTSDTGQTETVTVTVHGADDPINTMPDSVMTESNQIVTIDVLANDRDVDTGDQPLTLTAVTQPAAGMVSIFGNEAVFDPQGDFDYLGSGETATVTFIYTASNADGLVKNELVTITIGTAVGNTLPTAMDDSGVTDQNSTVSIDAVSNDSDPDSGNTLLIAAVDDPAMGSVSISSENQILFDPGSDFDYLGAMESETVTFDYLLSDGEGGTDTATVTVTVNGVDDATVTAPDAEQTDEGSAVTIDVLANDSDPDNTDNPLSIASVTQPADANDGVVVNNTGVLTFTPGSNFDILGPGESATTTFAYTTDTGVTETVTVTVNGINHAPNAADDSVVAFRDRPVSLDLTSNDDDPDGDPLTVVSAGGASNGTVSIDPVSGNVTYTPDSGFTGNDSFTYTISDGNGGIDVASVDVTVLSQPGNRDGIWGGHFDLDYDTSLGGDTEGHHHAYDDDFDVLGVDYFNAQGTRFNGVNDEVNTSQQFKIIVANGDLSPSARISINQVYDENDPSTYMSVTEYDDIALEDLTVFSLDGNGSSTLLTSLTIMFPVTAMVEAGFFPSQTGAVRDNTPGADGEWRNGALTLQLVEVDGNGDNFTTNLSLSNGGVQGVATSGLVYESTIFWHWDGPTYDDNSPYVPGDPSSVAAYVEPIVIDLDGDGVEFDGVSDGITFDVDGDGIAERTAWANQDDGVLVYDENDNNHLDGRSEFAFAEYSENPDATDLEGLRHFDTNNDLILDANDDEFESFKLWQDRDGDGEVGEGEMMTLEEAGIESLELTSDGEAYYTAGGDVLVNGEAGVNYADGSKGVLADAEFRYEELTSDDESLEVVADDGQVIDVNKGDADPGPGSHMPGCGCGDCCSSSGEATPDLLQPAPPEAGDGSGELGFEGGAVSGTTFEDDMAASDAAMS